MRLLITNASNALAYKVLKYFNARYTVLIDSKDLPQLQTTAYTLLPCAYKFESMVHQILSICLDYSIDTVCPLLLNEKQTLMSNVTLFEEFGIQIIDNPF